MYQAAPLQSHLLGSADRRVQVTSAAQQLSRTLRPSVKPGAREKTSPALGPSSSAPFSSSTICFLKQAANRSEVWSGALRENYGSGGNKQLTRLDHELLIYNLLEAGLPNASNSDLNL